MFRQLKILLEKKYNKRNRVGFYEERLVECNNPKDVDVLKEKKVQQINADIDFSDERERKHFITENCEQIIAASKAVEEMREKYAAVTSYLSDVRKVKELPKDRRKDLNQKVYKVLQLNDEKELLKKKQKNDIPDERYEQMAAGADVIPKDIKQLEEYENYHRIVEEDLRKLEGERASLKYESRITTQSQDFLKFVMTSMLMLVVIMACMFLCMQKLFKTSMSAPFMIMVLVAGIICVYVTVKSTMNKRAVKENAAKMNRLVELMNKTKIKYVNGKNIIDYMYEKYDIKSSRELKKYWGEYQKKCESESAFVRNIKLYDSYSMLIIDDLRKYGVRDADVWMRQLDAIVDEDKMQQMNDRLEQRREKLMRTIEYNNQLRDDGISAIRCVIECNNVYKSEIVEILQGYGLDI